MKKLNEIIDWYGSDKNLSGYTPYYVEIFESIRNNKIELLEIGIGTIIVSAQSSMANTKIQNYKPGASLRSWQEYFPNANIYGGDIQLDTQFSEDRIKTFLFDSTKKSECDFSLQDMNFDIIIDDGWHWYEAQLNTFDNLFSRVKSGGYYIIEDIESGGNSPLFSELEKKLNGIKYTTSTAKNLLIICKP
jgi:hypothetical protein